MKKYSVLIFCAIILGVLLLMADVGRAEVTILAMGDSTTAGTPGFRSPVENPPDGSGNPQSQYAYWMMQRHPKWRVLNRGVNGERIDQMARRFQTDVATFHPDAVIILAGVNDLCQDYSAERVKSRLKALYDEAQKNHLKVMTCTILPYNGSSPSARAGMRRVNEWIRSYSKKSKLGFCDLFTALQHPHRPWNLISTADGLHPDVAGYRRMGEALTNCLEQQFPELNSR